MDFPSVLLTLLVLTLIPWFIAKARSHHNSLAILMVCLFLGWTVIGWIGALVWACTSPAPRT